MADLTADAHSLAAHQRRQREARLWVATHGIAWSTRRAAAAMAATTTAADHATDQVRDLTATLEVEHLWTTARP